MFTALLLKCSEKNVFALCRYIPRRNTPPRFVALVPQREELDQSQTQATPPGTVTAVKTCQICSFYTELLHSTVWLIEIKLWDPIF